MKCKDALVAQFALNPVEDPSQLTPWFSLYAALRALSKTMTFEELQIADAELIQLCVVWDELTANLNLSRRDLQGAVKKRISDAAKDAEKQEEEKKKAAAVEEEKRKVKKTAASVDAAATATKKAASVDYGIFTGGAGDIKPLFNDMTVVPIDEFKAICIMALCPNRTSHQIQKRINGD